MEREQNIEELLNTVQLLRKALEFYADEINYKNTSNNSKVELDKGHQARFALEQSEYLDKMHEDILHAFDTYKKNMGENVPDLTNVVELFKLFKKYEIK